MLISKDCVIKSLKDLPETFTIQDLQEQISVFHKVEAELVEIKKVNQDPMEDLRTKILKCIDNT